MSGVIISVPEKIPGALHKQFPCHHLWWQKHNIAVSPVTECWAVPAEANLPPASLRGWCSEVTPLGRRALGTCVCLFICMENNVCVCCSSECVFLALPFCVSSGDFTSSSYTLSGVFTGLYVCSVVSHCMCTSKSVFVCLQCNVLCFTCNPSPRCAPPYLSPMEMRRGQGIWGEEHREAALHNLKGILMNQHSRTAYSHDNRPQTNSCIWSPLVLWLWKCCMRVCVCVVVFVFGVQ